MARQRGRLWQADVRTKDGKRLRPTFKTQLLAEAWEFSARLAIEKGMPIPIAQNEPSKRKLSNNLQLLGSLHDFVSRTEWRDARASTTLIRNGRHVCEYFGFDKDVTSITPSEIAMMKVHFAEKGLTPATVNRKIAALSKMLRIALDNGIISSMPRIKWNEDVKTKFRFLDDDEEKLLLKYWELNNDQEMVDLTTLLLDTGARCYSEMMAAKWDDFGGSFKTVTFWHTKTNKPRTVPLTKRSVEIIKRLYGYKGDNAGPFTNVSKGRMRSTWDTMRGSLNFHDVTPHTLRHTCCTRLVAGGADLKRVMEWMGHTAVQTTMRYMQMRPDALTDILAILDKDAA